MSSDTSMKETCAKLRESLRAQLRTEYPYLKDAALERMLTNAMSVLGQELDEQEPVMAVTKARISFKTLSAELRNAVYEYAALDFDPSRHFQDVEEGNYVEYGSWIEPLFKIPGLLSTCKQIRAEALPVFWAGMTVKIYAGKTDRMPSLGEFRYSLSRNMSGLLNRLGTYQAGLLTRVVVIGVKSHREPPDNNGEFEEKVKKHLDLAQYGINLDAVSVQLLE